MALAIAPRFASTGVSPRSAILSSIVSPYVFYKMYEGTGTNLLDTHAYGPTLAVGDTTTNLWSKRAYATMDVAGNYAIPSPLSNVNLANLFDLTNVQDAGQLLIAWDFIWDGGTTGVETFFGYGADTNGATAGGWWFNFNTSNQIQFSSRGVTAAAAVTTTFTSFNAFTAAQGANSVAFARVSLLADIRVGGGKANISLYSNGNSVTSITGHDLLNGGTGLPGSQSAQPFCLFGRKNSTAGSASANFTQKLGSAGSNGSMALFFAMRRSTASNTLPLTLNTQFYQQQGEYPLALAGA